MKNELQFWELSPQFPRQMLPCLRFKIIPVLLFFLHALAFTTYAQDLKVSGVVKDANDGLTLPGVNVVIKGTIIGTVTDSKGEFDIEVSDENTTLVFSFIGYMKQEVPVNGQSLISVDLKVEETILDEILIVGYGTQRKADVTGSISSIDVEDIKNVSTPTIAQSIQGRTSGVFVKVQNSQPGDYSGIQYNIRGFGDALLIIDGIPATKEEFLLLDPNDIEEMNVLKDAASAAVYGARAGNGVILVKTKRGIIQAPKFNYNGTYGVQKLNMRPHQVNSWQYAQFENVAAQNAGRSPVWTQDDIAKFKAGDDPAYPNTDWWGLTLRKYAPETQHNVSVQGGTEKVKYFVSGGYRNQEGLYRSGDLKTTRYNLRTNLDIALTDKLSLGINLSLLDNNYIGPSWNMTWDEHWGIMTMLYRSRPFYPASFPDPTKPVGMGSDDPNPVTPTYIDQVGYNKWNSFTSDNRVMMSYELPFGLTARSRFSYKRTMRNEKRKELEAPVYWMDYDEFGEPVYHHYLNYNSFNMVRQTNTIEQNYAFQGMLAWNRTFGDHKIDVLGVYEYLASDGEWFNAQRIRYQYDIDFLFAGPIEDASNNGSGWQDGRVGQIFTLDYGFKDKYLFGFKVRRDGSPKFPSDRRWGVFPSVSLGWRISEENFLQDNLPVVSNLKLRGSWGKLGFDAIGNFQYLTTYSIRSASAIMDGAAISGIRADNIPNENITWEKMTTSNIGLDFGLLDDKITGSFDVFHRLRTDVLGNRQLSVPDVVGASLPTENINEFSNRGAEFSLAYNTNPSKDLHGSFGGNVSFAREKIEYIDQPTFASEEQARRNNKVGEWSDQIWGWKTDGLFTSQEEIDNWPIMDNKGNATVNPGDIKYVDYNGDGIITNEDQVIIGRGTSPDMTFAVFGTVNYKGFTLSAMFQGAGLFDLWYGRSADISQPFMGGDSPLVEMYEQSWTPENEWGIPANKSQNVNFPRYYTPGYPTKNTWSKNSFWFKNGTYLRLKTIEVGYNLPKDLVSRVNIDNVKMYVSGFNVWTWSALDFMDPEQEKEGGNPWNAVMLYPPTGSYQIGLVLDF